MKITFLCGCLEPGRDGVGDYTRRLAGELIRQKHHVAIVALNDNYVVDKVIGVQSSEDVKLPVLRMPSTWPAKERFSYAKVWINTFNPEVLSLQFVVFSFHPKGLPYNTIRHLSTLGERRRWHIMFHELWVGMAQGSGFKSAMWGRVQQWLIQSLVKNLKPIVVHTQTKLYQMQLAKLDIDVEYLPLFSNIPVLNDGFSANANLNTLCIENRIYFVLFGGIHSGSPVEEFAQEVASYAKENDAQFILKIVGRCGVEQERWATIWRSVGLVVELIGEQSAENVSRVLRSAHIGISTTPVALAEKSGAVAAMKEHGLLVICVRDAWKAKGIMHLPTPEGITEYHVGNLRNIIKNKIKIISESKISAVTSQFVSDITNRFAIH